MRNAPTLFTAAVFVAVGVGYCRARQAESVRLLPAFAPPPGAQLGPLDAPIGEFALAGQVVDIDSNPAAGVSVFVRSNDVPLWAETDADGRFRLLGLVGGPHEIALVKWGHPPRVARVDEPREDLVLTLAPPKPPPPPLPQIATAALAGRVAHPLGGNYADEEGYELQFEPRGDLTDFGAAVLRRVSTDARGFFALEDLAHGDYFVHVLPSWAAGGSWPDLVSLADAQFAHAPDGGDFAVFGLEAGALEATVVDPDGQPIDGAYAILADAEDASRVWPPRVSDAFGLLRFSDLPPGRYRLSLRAGESPIEELVVEVHGSAVERPTLPPLAVRKR